MKVYTVVWSDQNMYSSWDRRKHSKVYTSLTQAKAALTRRRNQSGPECRVTGVILESEINWTPWDGK